MSTSVPQTMRAVVLQGPGDTSALQVHQVPVPQPESGWVLIRVRAAGLNRSELHTRLGLHEYMEQNRATGKIVVTP
jgi:NADPH2:quinone reductase